MPPRHHRKNAISDSGWQFVRPLADSLRTDADSFGNISDGAIRSADQFDGLLFAHGILNHAFSLLCNHAF